MSQIKFIFFDIGGVLIDWRNAFKTVSAKFKIPFAEFINEWNIYNDRITRGKITPQEFWNHVKADLKIKEGKNFDFLDNWVSDYKPILEMHRFVYELSNTYKIGLLTNLYKGMLPILIRKKLIPNISYSSIVTSCETGLRKPEGEIYKLATKIANSKPEEILLVDDREDFIEGAKKVGWQTYLFKLSAVNKTISELTQILKKSN